MMVDKKELKEKILNYAKLERVIVINEIVEKFKISYYIAKKLLDDLSIIKELERASKIINNKNYYYYLAKIDSIEITKKYNLEELKNLAKEKIKKEIF